MASTPIRFSITRPLFDYPAIEPFRTGEKHSHLKPDRVHHRALRQGDIKIFHGSSLLDHQQKLSASLKFEGGTAMISGSVETEFDQTSRSTTTMEFATALDLYSRALLTLPDERELIPILRLRCATTSKAAPIRKRCSSGTAPTIRESVDDRPVFIDFAPDSLRPLWDLCEDAERRAELRDAYEDFARSRPTPGRALDRADLPIPSGLS